MNKTDVDNKGHMQSSLQSYRNFQQAHAKYIILHTNS